MKKLLIALLAGTLVLSSGAASVMAEAESPEISGTITFWTSADLSLEEDHTVQWILDTVELFQEKYPNVTVEPTYVSSGEEYLTKITTEVAAGNAPDVFRTYLTGRLEPFVQGGQMLPLEHLFETYPETAGIMNPNGLELATFDDQVYAIPLIASGEMFFYNKQIFADNGLEVPKTYDDLLNIIEVLKGNEIIPCYMGISDPWPGTIPYMMLFNRMNGNDLYESVILGKEADFTNEAFIKTGEALQDLVNTGMFNDTIAAITQEEAQVKFYSGESAMIIDGSWAVPTYTSHMGDNVGIFNFPDMENEIGNSNHWLMNFDEGYGISSKTQNQDAAEAFLAFMYSPERQAAFAETGAIIGCQNVEYDTSLVPELTSEVVEAFAGAEYSIIPWDNPLGTDVGAELNNATMSIITGGDVTEAFENLQYYAEDAWE